jgi:hypothetical protein
MVASSSALIARHREHPREAHKILPPKSAISQIDYDYRADRKILSVELDLRVRDNNLPEGCSWKSIK